MFPLSFVNVLFICYRYDDISIRMRFQMIGKREKLCSFMKKQKTVNN